MAKAGRKAGAKAEEQPVDTKQPRDVGKLQGSAFHIRHAGTKAESVNCTNSGLVSLVAAELKKIAANAKNTTPEQKKNDLAGLNKLIQSAHVLNPSCVPAGYSQQAVLVNKRILDHREVMNSPERRTEYNKYVKMMTKGQAASELVDQTGGSVQHMSAPQPFHTPRKPPNQMRSRNSPRVGKRLPVEAGGVGQYTFESTIGEGRYGKTKIASYTVCAKCNEIWHSQSVKCSYCAHYRSMQMRLSIRVLEKKFMRSSRKLMSKVAGVTFMGAVVGAAGGGGDIRQGNPNAVAAVVKAEAATEMEGGLEEKEGNEGNEGKEEKEGTGEETGKKGEETGKKGGGKKEKKGKRSVAMHQKDAAKEAASCKQEAARIAAETNKPWGAFPTGIAVEIQLLRAAQEQVMVAYM
jgi:hypothetical protein